MDKIIHFTVPERSTPIQVKAIQRARELHPDWDIKVWQDPVQAGGYLLERYWPRVKSGAQFADLLRLDLVYRWGGVYVDSDLLLLRPLDELAEHYKFFLASEDGTYLTNALFGAERNHHAILAIIKELLGHEPDWTAPVWITTGPDLFSRILRSREDVTVLPRETFYSYNWDEPDSKRNHRHSYGEHLWAKSWWSPEIRDRYGAQDQPRRLTQIARHYAKLTLNQTRLIWRKACYGNISPLRRLRFHAEADERVVQAQSEKSRYARFVKSTVRGGDWIIDVDVDTSFSVLAALSVGMFGRVFAYQPSQSALELLETSVKANDAQGRVVMKAAEVGSTRNDAAIRYSRNETDASTDASKSRSVQADESNAPSPTLADAPLVTLDEEFPIDLPIKLLRIGARGCETAVLQGARRLVDHRCIDFILVELTAQRSGPQWTEFLARLALLTQAGYAACTVNEGGSLVRHPDVGAAANQPGNTALILVARDQYTDAS